MKADLVDPTAVTVMRIELGQIMVGERAELQMRGCADFRAEALEVFDRPLRAFPRDRVPQGGVRREQVVIRQFARLIENLMRGRVIAVRGPFR